MYKLQHPDNLSILEVEKEFIKNSNTLSNLLNDLDSVMELYRTYSHIY